MLVNLCRRHPLTVSINVSKLISLIGCCKNFIIINVHCIFIIDLIKILKVTMISFWILGTLSFAGSSRNNTMFSKHAIFVKTIVSCTSPRIHMCITKRWSSKSWSKDLSKPIYSGKKWIKSVLCVWRIYFTHPIKHVNWYTTENFMSWLRLWQLFTFLFDWVLTPAVFMFSKVFYLNKPVTCITLLGSAATVFHMRTHFTERKS